MLQKTLNKDDVVTAIVVDRSRVPFAEAVCADVGIAKIIANHFEVSLNLPDSDREQEIVVRDLVCVCVVAEKGVDFVRHGETPLLPRLLFGHVQAVSAAVFQDIGHMETQNVSNPHAKVRFGCEDSRNPWVGAADLKSIQKCMNDRGVLGIGKSYHDVHPQLCRNLCCCGFFDVLCFCKLALCAVNLISQCNDPLLMLNV